MPGLSPDEQERVALCDLFDDLGAEAPTLLDGWTTRLLAAHLVVRERDPLAGPCLVLPGRFARFAHERTASMAETHSFGWLVDRIRCGPPFGFFRLPWVRSFPTLNEFFVHHEDVRRANGMLSRENLSPAMEAALWHNACSGARYLSRRVRGTGLKIEWADTGRRHAVRSGSTTAVLRGAPGELLLYLFGRQDAAAIEVLGPPQSVATVRNGQFGM